METTNDTNDNSNNKNIINNNENNNNNNNNKKTLDFKLKPMPPRDYSKNKNFSKLTDVLMSFNLFPFLTENEILSFGKINTRFYNAYIRYIKYKNDLLIPKYNINNDKSMPLIFGEFYQQKDDKGHYIKFNKIFNIEHYSLFAENDWTWKNDKRYWESIEVKNCLCDKKEAYHLLQVCWVDVNQKISHVFGGKYNLYLNHCVCNLTKNCLKLKIILDEDDKNPIFEASYPSQELIDNCRNRHAKNNTNNNNIRERRFPLRIKKFSTVILKEKRVDKDFICDINIPLIDSKFEKNGHNLIVRFDHDNNGNWKQGWIIDGFILEKIVLDNYKAKEDIKK